MTSFTSPFLAHASSARCWWPATRLSIPKDGSTQQRVPATAAPRIIQDIYLRNTRESRSSLCGGHCDTDLPATVSEDRGGHRGDQGSPTAAAMEDAENGKFCDATRVSGAVSGRRREAVTWVLRPAPSEALLGVTSVTSASPGPALCPYTRHSPTWPIHGGLYHLLSGDLAWGSQGFRVRAQRFPRDVSQHRASGKFWKILCFWR